MLWATRGSVRYIGIASRKKQKAELSEHQKQAESVAGARSDCEHRPLAKSKDLSSHTVPTCHTWVLITVAILKLWLCLDLKDTENA